MGITRDTNTNEIMLVMEFMQHGSLEDLLFPKHSTCQKVTLECQDVIQIALDVATGLKYLHSQSPKIIHRSLSSASILVSYKLTHCGSNSIKLDKYRRAKISDFGTTKFLGANSAAAALTDSYGSVAPEVTAEQDFNEKADIFS